MKHSVAALVASAAVMLGAAGLNAQAAAASTTSARLKAHVVSSSPWSTGTLAETPQADPTSVSCPTASFCAAIDRFGNEMTYNGVSWNAPSLVDPDAGGIGSPMISCVSAAFCAVVDTFGNALIFNGKAWSAPDFIDTDYALDSVSCASVSFCIAVDLYGSAFEYDGGTWTELAKPVDLGHEVTSVSCPSAKFCVAVDNSGFDVVYNGTSWSSAVQTNVSGAELASVSCFSSTFCAAVSARGNAVIYGGTSWGASKSVDGTRSLKSVSCFSTTACMAVDSAGNAVLYSGVSKIWSTDPIDTLGKGLNAVSCDLGGMCAAVDFAGNALIYNGTWGALTSIDPTSTHGLTSVSCPSTSFCAASDLSANVLTYDGTTWGPLTAVPGFTASGNSYISCASSSFCAAVDSAGEATVFDGSTWSTPVSIDTGTNSVTSLSCVASFCVAVDNAGNAITFDGTSWGAVDPIDASHDLASVSCIATVFCVALDNAGNAVVYTGTWAVPVSIDGTNDLTSVSCTSSNFCAAADSTGSATTYNGKIWTSPVEADSHGAMITALSCASQALCVAVDTDNYAFVFAPTTTTITSASAAQAPIVGQAFSIGVQVTSAVAGRTPTGQVKVNDGFHSCTATISGSGGTAMGSCSLTEQVVGFYGVVATYAPNASFAGSSSPLSSLDVAAASSSTSISSSLLKVAYGHEQVATIFVVVSPQFAALTPTGTVAVTASTNTVCQVVLQGGSGFCTLPPRELGPGVFRLVASYPGAADLVGSSSATTILTVVKQSAKTTLHLSARKVTYGHEQIETVSVKVSAQYAGSPPTGRVTIKRSAKTLCVITLSKGNGSCRFSSSKVPVGSYRLVAAYGGSSDFAPSSSTKQALAVVK